MKISKTILFPALALAAVGVPLAIAQQPTPAPAQLTCAQTDNPTLCASIKPGPTDRLQIVTGGKTLDFNVELADSEPERNQGLMYRTSMPETGGMIFDMQGEVNTGFYMKNTLIPLDMLFIDGKGKVIAIAANARPGSLRSVSPGFPFNAVLELNGGAAKKLGLKIGDTVKHKMFKNLT